MNDGLTVRRAAADDVERVLLMFDHSRQLMRASGNDGQWVGYPTRHDVCADLADGSLLMVECEGSAVGCFSLVAGVDPNYGFIEHGRWLDAQSAYATIHRLACNGETHGVAAAAFAFAKSHCPYLRADTHRLNAAMLHILEKEGFVRSGTVYMADGGAREAFEWWRFDEVRPEVKAFVENEVMPLYDGFDDAHGRAHARRVIARAMLMAKTMAVDPEMVFVAAAMHDVGLGVGRAEHHLESARLIRADKRLLRWFSAAEIEVMAQAAADHRASAKEPPQSLYGCIVAEADRDIEPETIVWRTVRYGLDHYPHLDREQHWQRALAHLKEKYGREGYLTLWLPQSPNAEPLDELRCLIDDEPRLRLLFNTFMS